jgi:hypothetical protein
VRSVLTDTVGVARAAVAHFRWAPGAEVPEQSCGGRGDAVSTADRVAVATSPVAFRTVEDGVEAASPFRRRGSMGSGADGAGAMADAGGNLDWAVSVDSTVVRVHQHGANAARHTGGSTELHEPA